MINDEIFTIYFQNRGLNVVSPDTATEPIAGIGDVCKCIFIDANIEASSTSRFIMVDDYIDDSVFR